MADQPQEKEFQHDLMEDFFLDFQEAHQHCESTLIDLEHSPADTALLNDLFRSVHTVKGNLVYVGLKDLTPLLQSVEDVLDLVRSHRAEFDTLLSDVILLAMDKTKQWVQARVEDSGLPMSETQHTQLCQQISRITELEAKDRNAQVQSVIKTMDPQTQITTPRLPSTGEKSLLAEPNEEDILRLHKIELNEDLLFFQQLSAPLEQRSHYFFVYYILHSRYGYIKSPF